MQTLLPTTIRKSSCFATCAASIFMSATNACCPDQGCTPSTSISATRRKTNRPGCRKRSRPATRPLTRPLKPILVTAFLNLALAAVMIGVPYARGPERAQEIAEAAQIGIV